MANLQDKHDSTSTAGATTKDDKAFEADDYGVYLDEDDDEEEKWIRKEDWYRIQTACLVFFLQEGLPANQQWMFYLLFLHFHQDFYPSLYVYSVIPVFFMWYWPQIGRPVLVQGLLTAADQYMRGGYSYSKSTTREWGGMLIFYAMPINFLIYNFSMEGSVELLESIFGHASTWPSAIIPIIPWLYLSSSHEKDSLNGFVPEGKEGILLAVFVRACAGVLPLWLQWFLWAFISGPAELHPSMVVEWIVCTLTWTLCGTSPQGAYAIYLLANQYPHARSWFRHHGGGPSIILQQERRGTLWFVATSVMMRIVESEAGPSIFESGALDLSPKVWLPLVLVMAIGLYLLRYGIAIRAAKYKHRPLGNNESIRLLRLRAQPCSASSPVQCDMIHSTLRNPPPYIAVSHRWGRPDEDQEIILIDGSPFLISPSLHAFLKAKRSSVRHVIVWIDSICINQGDVAEKSIQVGMMRRVYEEALFTVGWLGENPGAEKAFKLMKQVNATTTTRDFTAIWNEEKAGWTELRNLLSNEWFERVWIIQEIAVAKKSLLRCGNQEMEWCEFTRALFIIMALGTQGGQIENFGDSRGALNAVIMENIRLQVDDVDYLRLKDMLKLGLNFKASLAVDKVYGLLGVIEERRTPLFHPSFSADESFSKVISRRRVFGDVSTTLRAINDLLGTANGNRRTRTGRGMLRSVDKGLRHFAALTRDLGKINSLLERKGSEGNRDFAADMIEPNYSKEMTSQLVYTYVARDLVMNNDAISFIPYAGIGFARDKALAAMPSWVPDWSREVKTYMLPRIKPPKLDRALEGEVNGSKEASDEPAFCDAGPTILLVKCTMLGEITHLAPLSYDFVSDGSGIREQAERDFMKLSSNYKSALELAIKHTGTRYGEEENVEEAFYRTLRADMSDDGSRPARMELVVRQSLWALGQAPECPVSDVFMPEEHKDWDEDTKTRICERYLATRRTQSSLNSKFAHMVRTDIAPSFSRYRLVLQKKGHEEQELKRPLSMFDDVNGGPLSSLSRYVDYTLGRRFAILGDSGFMGLVPEGALEGDVVVWIKKEDLCLVLRRENVSGALEKKIHGKKDAFKLVGEAYVYDLDAFSCSEMEICVI